MAETPIDKVVPGTFSLSETFDVGVDNGTPVSKNYKQKEHFRFTGQIDKVVINLVPENAEATESPGDTPANGRTESRTQTHG